MLLCFSFLLLSRSHNPVVNKAVYDSFAGAVRLLHITVDSLQIEQKHKTAGYGKCGDVKELDGPSITKVQQGVSKFSTENDSLSNLQEEFVETLNSPQCSGIKLEIDKFMQELPKKELSAEQEGEAVLSFFSSIEDKMKHHPLFCSLPEDSFQSLCDTVFLFVFVC